MITYFLDHEGLGLRLWALRASVWSVWEHSQLYRVWPSVLGRLLGSAHVLLKHVLLKTAFFPQVRGPIKSLVTLTLTLPNLLIRAPTTSPCIFRALK